jgi:hypothetical protein
MAGERLSKSDATKRLRWCLENGIVEYHDHFGKRCRERGIDPQDAQRVLQKGTIYQEPELNVSFQEWRYRVEWTTPEGQAIALIIAFPEDNETLAITAIALK